MADRLEFVKIEVKDFINQYFYRYKILENEFEKFKESLTNYIEELEKHKDENEDFLVANCLSPFFKKLNFETKIKSKMKGKSEIDLSIVKNSNIQIIIEAKKPNDKDFFGFDNPNCKALHEAILYYFRIREENNFSIKYIILTDFYKFYIFEAKEFEKVFYRNKDFETLYKSFKNQNSMFDGRTEEFYSEAKKILERKNFNLKGSLIDLNDISDILKDGEKLKTNFKNLKPYFKIFSGDFLLQEFNPNDANELNKGFYDELLHILGLSEKVINKKTLIVPSKNSIDREGTLYYNILQRLPEDKRDEKENEINEKVLEILIIWINRILFLKLLESSLINFNNDKNLGFLNIEKIKDYNKLNYLFFNILAKNKEDRESQTAEDLAYLPYLNSSLFTRSEKEIIDISQLSNLKLEYFKNTQIKDENGKAKRGKEDWLKMIFEFLNSFDFGARDDNENILAQKDLINSSVLGLVFEKLNGYKEGSFYTPSFITSYMCKESLEKIVLQKFNDKNPSWNAQSLEDIEDEIRREIRKARSDKSLDCFASRCAPRIGGQSHGNARNDEIIKNKYKAILETIRICDPAVGSGHFLVSALNEIVYIYYKLGLLNIPISDLKIENDEILIKDNFGKNFEYIRPRLENDNHKIQRTLFNLKKSIIENNLFGVDINRNSCEITKLRLWIELLKNSYYLSFDKENYHNLQTLPNIDINIKCGNSLISNIDFGISKDNFLSNLKSRIDKADMFERETLKKELEDIEKELPKRFENAKAQAKIYKNSSDKTEAKKSKDIFEESILYLIKLFKRTCNEYINFYQGLHDFFYTYGYININNISDGQIKTKLKNYIEYFKFHEFVSFEKSVIREAKEKELSKIKTLMEIYEDFESKKTFEWRFEFPEVLDNEGNFTGFDLIIGNPPYVVKKKTEYTQYEWNNDLYTMFFEMGFKITKYNHYLNFITPRFWLVNINCEKMRKYFLNSVNLISLSETNPFEQAATENVISEFQICNPKQNTIKHYKENKQIFNFINKIDKKYFISNSKYEIIFNINKDLINLFDKISKNTIQLKSIMETKRGAEYGKNFIKTFNNGMKILLGYDMQAYTIKWNNSFVDANLKDINRLLGFFKTKNLIYLRRVDKRLSASISNETFAFTKNIYGIKITDTKYNHKLILALLNSKLLNFYYLNKFTTKKEDIFPEIQTYLYEQLPIPEINSENKELEDKIVGLVDKVIVGKKNNEDTIELEDEIDKIVYRLYDLTEEEIRIVENR